MNNETINGAQDNHMNDLGLIICKICSQVVGSLPTNGYKKMYVICDNENCNDHQGGNNK